MAPGAPGAFQQLGPQNSGTRVGVEAVPFLALIYFFALVSHSISIL